MYRNYDSVYYNYQINKNGMHVILMYIFICIKIYQYNVWIVHYCIKHKCIKPHPHRLTNKILSLSDK